MRGREEVELEREAGTGVASEAEAEEGAPGREHGAFLMLVSAHFFSPCFRVVSFCSCFLSVFRVRVSRLTNVVRQVEPMRQIYGENAVEVCPSARPHACSQACCLLQCAVCLLSPASCRQLLVLAALAVLALLLALNPFSIFFAAKARAVVDVALLSECRVPVARVGPQCKDWQESLQGPPPVGIILSK